MDWLGRFYLRFHMDVRTPSTRSPRILLADDSIAMRHTLRNLLEGQDRWRVCAEAADGVDAVRKTEQCIPDVILMDFQMPHMNGLDAAKEIRRRRPAIPILMVSLHMSSQLAEEARRIGIRGICAKSDIGCVVEAVQTLLADGTYYKRERDIKDEGGTENERKSWPAQE
ncbi:MAG TPA: response regulator transcription factor [Candidatus Sulfotelmatobacter sp.]|nr:response regulator transcription factor [Candidatus Sulfotelmatobacter sp.]